MRELIYSMGVSLDGFVAGPGGEIDWAAPDAELHRFHNEQSREITVLPVRAAPVRDDADLGDGHRAARGPGRGKWSSPASGRRPRKLVFSTTLSHVEGNARLARASPDEELADLRREAGDGQIAVGGASLAGDLARLDLIDEYRLFVSPLLLGGGTAFFTPLARTLDLELVETRVFGSRVVYMRYRRVRGAPAT